MKRDGGDRCVISRWSASVVQHVPALCAALAAADALQAFMQGVLRRLALQRRRQEEHAGAELVVLLISLLVPLQRW